GALFRLKPVDDGGDQLMVKAITENGIDWYDPVQWGAQGKGWQDTLSPYDRLPAKAQAMVPQTVWNLSRNSAGLYVEFETDATTIEARWTLTSPNLALPHMPATSVSGVDLYVADDDGNWHW